MEYRKRIEDQAHKALLQCYDEQNRLAAKKDEIRQKIKNIRKKYQEEKCRGVCVSDIILFENCIDSLHTELQFVFRQLGAIEKTIRKKQDLLVQARQEKKILEILKANRQKEEQQRLKKMENLFLDEVSLQCFGVKK